MKKNNEKGALIVEASIVFPVMFLVIFFMLFAGNAYFQKCRVEAIVTEMAFDGAAYCADPLLESAEKNAIPGVAGHEVYPYRFFSSKGVGNVEASIQEKIDSRIEELSTGLFLHMEPEDISVSTDYSPGILYATFSADTSYKIKIPIRLLGEKDFFYLRVSTHIEMPVSDTSELIRDIDMIWDYLERFGVAEKVGEAKAKLENAIEKVNKWFDG